MRRRTSQPFGDCAILMKKSLPGLVEPSAASYEAPSVSILRAVPHLSTATMRLTSGVPARSCVQAAVLKVVFDNTGIA
jgi:hypothetical protein